MVKKVLFFDIDGTLLNSELKIPEGVKKELKRLKDAGHYLFVASGRPLAFISNQIIEAGFDGFVLCNGAHVELLILWFVQNIFLKIEFPMKKWLV